MRFNDSIAQLFPRPERPAVNATENNEQSPPPHWGVLLRQHRVGEMRPFRKSADKNQNSIDQQEHAYKKPDRDYLMFFTHNTSPENDLQNDQYD